MKEKRTPLPILTMKVMTSTKCKFRQKEEIKENTKTGLLHMDPVQKTFFTVAFDFGK